ncbi:MAG: aldo/keto reductase, partial [Cyanobacteria bacterium P01_F01_bin.53]
MSSGADFETFDYALTLGCNFGDTADMYGPFLNEELLAKAIAGRRDRIILATKFGVMHNLP